MPDQTHAIPELTDFVELVAYLSRTTRLTQGEAARVSDLMASWNSEDSAQC